MSADPRVMELAERLVEIDREQRRLESEAYRIRMEIAARISGGYVTTPEVSHE